jgi:hypothetical protein
VVATRNAQTMSRVLRNASLTVCGRAPTAAILVVTVAAIAGCGGSEQRPSSPRPLHAWQSSRVSSIALPTQTASGSARRRAAHLCAGPLVTGYNCSLCDYSVAIKSRPAPKIACAWSAVTTIDIRPATAVQASLERTGSSLAGSRSRNETGPSPISGRGRRWHERLGRVVADRVGRGLEAFARRLSRRRDSQRLRLTPRATLRASTSRWCSNVVPLRPC